MSLLECDDEFAWASYESLPNRFGNLFRLRIALAKRGDAKTKGRPFSVESGLISFRTMLPTDSAEDTEKVARPASELLALRQRTDP